MTNEYYNPSGSPSTGSAGSSATMRSEFTALQAGFALLPTLSGNNALPVFINAGATALEATAATTARIRLGLGSIATQDANNVTISGGTAKSLSALTTNNATITGGTITGTNLGSIATQNANNVAITGGTISTTANVAVTDNVFTVNGSSDATKQLRFEVDGLTGSTKRVWTAADKDITVAGTVDISAANGASVVLLQTNTPSAAATSDFTSILSATFDEYIFELIDVLPATDGSQLQLQTSTNNGGAWTGGVAYYYAGWQVNDAAGTATLTATAQAQVIINNNAGNAAGRGVSGDIKCWNGVAFRLSTHNNCINNAGSRVDTTLMGTSTDASVNAIRFKFSAGNIASGTIRLYGVRKT